MKESKYGNRGKGVEPLLMKEEDATAQPVYQISSRQLSSPVSGPQSSSQADDAAAYHPLRAVARPLLRRASIDSMKETLGLAGAGTTADALSADVERHAAFLQRCANEADAVLRGNLDAATRLWLLLREPIEARSPIPASILDQVAGDARRGPPRSLDGDALLRLIAGVVRAANQPAESEAMLEALGRLLQPLFQLDIAAIAAERARHRHVQALETFVTAWWASDWRAALERPRDPTVTGGGPVAFIGPFIAPSLDVDRDHVPPRLDNPGSKTSIDKWSWSWPCMEHTRLWASQIDRFGPRYTIDSLSNPQACAGHTVTIRGRNFGTQGRVSFESPDVKDPAFAKGAGDDGVLLGVAATRWTDSEVDVVVPVWATAGTLRLNAFTRHVDQCMTTDVYRLGNSIFFQGGLARVYEVSIRGVAIDLTSTNTRPTNLTPGDAVALTWRASGGPTTRIKVQLMDGPTLLWERSNLPGGFGGVVLLVPDPEPRQPRSATLVFTATSDCEATQPLRVPVWLSVAPRLTIEYVEVTQGVQGDLADVMAGRGMPTVANKDTAVRVHMNCDRGGWFSNRLAKITGALLVDGHRLAPTNVRVLLPPDRGFASIAGLSDPAVTNDTLNFTIPAAWLTPGTYALTVQLVCDDPSGKILVSRNLGWTWPAHNPLRVRALYMALYGSDGFMLDYTRRALDFLPTPLTDIGIAAPRWYSHTHDLSTDDGWSDLLDDLEDAWDDADEASGVRWLGIVPASERLPGMSLTHQGISGTPSIAALAMGDRPDVGAHEIGHSLGLHHINLPVDGPNHPKGPYDPGDGGGFLRRAPFDVRASNAIPLPAGDLMSYFEPIRPGISTWMRLFLNT